MKAEPLLRLVAVVFLAFIGAGLSAAWVVSVAPETGAALGLPDAGAVTHWLLPASRVFRDFAMALAIGGLFLAAFVLSPGSSRLGITGAAMDACTRVVRRACLAWLVSGISVLAFTYSELVGQPLSAIEPTQFRFFLTEFPLSRALLLNLAAAVAVPLILAVGQVRAIRGLAILMAVASVWPLATTGHAAGATNHDHAVNMQAIHILGLSVWFGGLLMLLLVWTQLDKQRSSAVRRYSRAAGWAFALVAGSGMTAAIIRLESWSGLTSSYGLLVLIKAGLLVLLGIVGWQQRRRFILHVETTEGASRFWRLAASEALILVAALGAGVALGGTPPPQDTEPDLTTAESLLGYSIPDALTAAGWLTSWRIDSLWVPISILAIGIYGSWVIRLRRRGDQWPIGRTVAWTSGWFAIVWATSGAPGVYGDVLFSVHMIQHMTVATTAPILLVLGAPVTLALRALQRRADGSSGPKEWLLYVVHSRLAQFLGTPLVAAGLFIIGLVAFYYSGLFEQSLRSHTAHNVMLVHFILSGYLFASVICGIDPGIRRPSYPMRILLVMVTFGFHAFFSISLMSATELLAGNWFPSLGRTWGASPLEDQRTGASIGWLLGDYPLAILAGALIWGWVRDDSREARRLDRQADRDGDAATTSYNAYLTALAGTSERPATEVREDVPPALMDQGANEPESEMENQ